MDNRHIVYIDKAADRESPLQGYQLAGQASMASSKSVALATLGRGKYVSQSALSAVLKEVKELPELPSATSRSSVKRARDELTESYQTPYGPVLQQYTLHKDDGGQITVPVLHPGAMLQYVVLHCKAFSDLLQQTLRDRPATHNRPYGLVWYSDEITPGNQLKHQNFRKMQAIYYSFQEPGPKCLSCEQMWFTLCSIRSSVVKSIGGMSVLWRQLAPLFFEQPDFRSGLVLNFAAGGEPQLFYANLRIMISDEAAIKASLCNKGASGLVFCVACQNAVDHKSLVSQNSAGTQISSLETNMQKFRQQTAASIQDTMSFLASQHGVLPKGEFEKLQTALGFNFKPGGLLAHPAYGPPVIDCVMFDWFHIYLVNGIFNIITGFLLATLHKGGWKQDAIGEFAQGFTWPARLRGGGLKGILDKRGSSGDALKCSASEGLNFMLVLRVFLVLFVLPACNETVKTECEAWLAMVRAIEMLQKVARETVSAVDLQRYIREHLDRAKSSWGEEWWIPKCHLALHLPLQLSKFGSLQSCFVHERKHKIVKKLANVVMDTSRDFERSILQDVLHGHLQALQDTACLPCHGVQLVKPVRAAPSKLAKGVCDMLQQQLDVVTSNQAVHGGNVSVSAKDVALIELEGRRLIGKVGYHVEAGGTCYSHVSFWTHVHGPMFRVRDDDVAMVETACIKDTCPVSLKGEDAIVRLP